MPDVILDRIVCGELARVWEETKEMRVPQYRSGDGLDVPTKRNPHPLNPKQNPRPIWDKAISRILSKTYGTPALEKEKEAGRSLWDLKRLNHWRRLLHREPHISGKRYNERG